MELLASPSASEIEAMLIISCGTGAGCVCVAVLLTCVAYTSCDVKTMGMIPFESVIF